MIKKIYLICVSIFLILLFTVVYFGNDIFHFEETRPENVPPNAVFKMGDWYELVDKIDARTYRIRIYRRINGTLKIDGIFKFDGLDLCFRNLDTTNILNNVSYYDRKIKLNHPKRRKDIECSLIPIEIFDKEDSTFKGTIELKEKIQR